MNLKLGLVLSAALMLAGHSSVAGAQDATATDEVDGGAQVSVAPLRLELAGTVSSAVLRVTNPSRREIGVQVRTFGWAQQGGEDSYFATNDVMISPSIIQIAPGQTQIFRVVRRDTPAAGEKRFRIAIDQLPDPELERGGEAQARIRFTLPLFLDRDQAAPADLGWTLDAAGLHARNGGGQTARIVGLTLTDSTGAEVPLEKNSLRYVQGGSTIDWPLSGTCPAGTLTVSTNFDGRTVSAPVSSSCN